MSTTMRAASGSSAENLFISLFEDVFGAEKTGYLYSQYPFKVGIPLGFQVRPWPDR